MRLSDGGSDVDGGGSWAGKGGGGMGLLLRCCNSCGWLVDVHADGRSSLTRDDVSVDVPGYVTRGG
jgi:hypothetical protein